MFRKRRQQIEYDEIFMDSSNLPAFNRGRLEGRLELPITNGSILVVGAIFLIISLAFLVQLFNLQVVSGYEYRERSEQNRINEALIIAERGVIYDRNGLLLAWNEHDYEDEYEFPVRAYTDLPGLGQLVGYVSYPQKDKQGFYYRTDYLGRTGLESAYEEILHGENGTVLVEENALSEVISAAAVKPPVPGAPITTTVDAELSAAMYDIIATSTIQAGFRSGAGAIMDVETGAIIAMTSFPSYDPEVMADGDDVELIESYNNDERFPFLNKVVGGAYTPGSVVKPFLAYAAIVEDIIDPSRVVHSNGELIIPNPYNPSEPSVFTDWREHGSMNMREAIAFSSNVYFYIIGGGLPAAAVPQAGLQSPLGGLGISRIDEYVRMFGLGTMTGIRLSSEQPGTVPNPEWKDLIFNDDWRLGDTYNTAIGQFGFQATPLQMLRAYAALANGGKLLTPQLIVDTPPEYIELSLDSDALAIVHEGMRKTVNFDGGTARSLERSDVAVAAKSGTAEVGAGNAFVNSWVGGFWPYEEPRYAFILLMDRAPRSNALGATRIMGDVMEWISQNRPSYLTNP